MRAEGSLIWKRMQTYPDMATLPLSYHANPFFWCASTNQNLGSCADFASNNKF